MNFLLSCFLHKPYCYMYCTCTSTVRVQYEYMQVLYAVRVQYSCYCCYKLPLNLFYRFKILSQALLLPPTTTTCYASATILLKLASLTIDEWRIVPPNVSAPSNCGVLPLAAKLAYTTISNSSLSSDAQVWTSVTVNVA